MYYVLVLLTYVVVIGKKLQTNEKLKRWLTIKPKQELQRD